VCHDDELRLAGPAALTPGHMGAPACACTVGTPVSRTKRSNSPSFRGESGRGTLE
jgi:hypothetical protein